MKINQPIERHQSWKVTPRDQYIEVEVYATDEHDWHTARLLPASGIDFGAALVQAGRVAQDAQRDREARKADIKLQLSPNARELVKTIERQQRDRSESVHGYAKALREEQLLGAEFVNIDSLISDVTAGNNLDIERARLLRSRLDQALLGVAPRPTAVFYGEAASDV